MIVIAESGATKTDWRFISEKSSEVSELKTGGMNISCFDYDAIHSSLKKAKSWINKLPFNEEVKSIYFFAAGLINNLPTALNKLFEEFFPLAKLECASDLVASARAVCGSSEGIAAILGTGSNCCLFDGRKIVEGVHPCGFILGDFGSAACLGKLFVTDFLQGMMPVGLSKEFEERYDVSYRVVVDNVYRGNTPAAYLGSFAPFLVEKYLSNDYVRKLIDRNFELFIDRCLMKFDTDKYSVGVTGGFGYACRDVFKGLGEKKGIHFSSFVKSPIDGLVNYYLNS